MKLIAVMNLHSIFIKFRISNRADAYAGREPDHIRRCPMGGTAQFGAPLASCP